MSESVRDGADGVRSTRPWIVAAAAATSSHVTVASIPGIMTESWAMTESCVGATLRPDRRAVPTSADVRRCPDQPRPTAREGRCTQRRPGRR